MRLPAITTLLTITSLAATAPTATATPTLAGIDLHGLLRRQVTATATPTGSAAASASPSKEPYSLPQLPFAVNDLEPYVSREIVQTHHQKHHAKYIREMNAAVAELNKGNITNLVNILSMLRYNAGGHVNHSLFWLSLAKANSTQAKMPSPETNDLAKAISSAWGSVDGLFKAIETKSQEMKGAGWIWLVMNHVHDLGLVITDNQDPVMEPYTPIFGIDLWEHSYYLQYKNDKVSYINGIKNVINWEEANKRFTGTLKPTTIAGKLWV